MRAPDPSSEPAAQRLALRLLAFAVAHFVLCRLGDDLSVAQSEFSTFWPASGLVLGALLLAPRREWPWYLLVVAASDVASGLLAGRRPALMAAYGAGDLLEAALGAWLISAAAARLPTARRPVGAMLALVGLGAVLAPGVAAVPGALVLAHLRLGGEAIDFPSFQQAWSGDALGVLLVAPAMLAWLEPSSRRRSSARTVEALALGAACWGAAVAVFGRGGGLHLERSYLLLPVLGWAAFRFGRRGASAAALGMGFVSAVATAALTLSAPLGTLVREGYQVQLLLAVCAAASLLLAATTEESALATSALEESERSLRLAQVALDRSLSATFFVDREGVVTYANEAAAQLVRRPPDELVGGTIFGLQAIDHQATWAARWEKMRAKGGGVTEGHLLRPGGERLDVEIAVTLVRHDDQEFAVVAARDLTERRSAEGAQRLASVGTLAAGMAHEINNPLTFVTSNLAFALDRLGPLRGDPRAEEAARALEDAEEGTRRVARVVRELKAASRVEDQARHPVDLHAEVEAALKLTQHELRHRARLATRLDPVPPVAASDFQLGQVLVNLLVNAAHAIAEGQADRHQVGVVTRTAPDGWAVVEVSDTGDGIPEAIRARIFEPFFTTKPVGQGTGLGLSVCHGIVSSLGGRIEVESEAGRGSLFRVLLPPARPAAPAPEAPAARRAEAPRARILVVDDEPLIGSTVRRLLSAHDVLALADGREALERLERGETFDLVLCDLMMPTLGGMDLYAAVQARRLAAADRFVFMTGGAFTERTRQFLETCGRPQLPKPFAPQELRDAVRGWLAGRC